MKIEKLFAFGLIWVAFASQAQGLTDLDPDWKESEAPPPPAFSQTKVVPITMPSYFSLKFGVDPKTISITPDGVVRYVMVASSTSGVMNALYEGVRCATGEVKTYARATSDAQWSVVSDPQWKALVGDQPSKHALAFARQGGCDGRTAPSSVIDLLNALKNPGQDKYKY